MAIAYNVYSNDGAGGPVNYSTPIATTTALTYVTTALMAGSNTTFAVRAFDASTNLEEANIDASATIILDANGNDVSARPNAPHALVLLPTSAGSCLVSWAFNAVAQAGVPVGFQIFLTEGTSVDYSSPAGVVPYIPGQVGYTYQLPGPYSVSTYTASVRSYNATTSDGNTITVTATIGLPTVPYTMDPVQITWT